MIKSISLYDAARWVASMVATDGVVSPRERKLLREFADTYVFNVTALYRIAYANANKVEIPEVKVIDYTKQKGRLFEQFVVRFALTNLVLSYLLGVEIKSSAKLTFLKIFYPTFIFVNGSMFWRSNI